MFRVIPGLVAFNNTPVLSTNTGVGLETLIPIDLNWYQNITDYLTALFRTVKWAPNIEFFTAVWCLMTMLWVLILPLKTTR